MSNLPILSDWDPELPTRPEQNAKEEIPPRYANRIFKDIKQFFTDPIHDIMLCPDSENLLIAHAIIIGPEKTPYEGGFFYFYIKLPNNYPLSPPMVKLMTTAQNTVRFNPNLYRDGKVCLSILNTWMGPQWSSGSTLSSVLLSIQSILNEEPFNNEPGAASLRNLSCNPVKQYNDIILHETIRVAVIGMMQDNFDTKHMPSVLKEFVTKYFETKLSYYDKVIEGHLHLDGQHMNDPFNEPRGTFQYKTLKMDIDKLRQKYCTQNNLTTV